MRDFMNYVYLPWVPLVESPKTKSRKNFQQPKRFSLPTWWFFWRKITAVLLRCVDYSIWRYNRGFSYQFFLWFVKEPERVLSNASRVDDNVVWLWSKRVFCLFTVRTSMWNALCRWTSSTVRLGAQRETASRPAATSTGLTRPPSHDRYNNYRNYLPHHCSSSVPSIFLPSTIF
jgi:hypothetical protein